MRRTTLRQPRTAEETRLEWLDLVNPIPADLLKIHTEFGIPLESLEDCLQPIHLPHFLIESGISHLFLRAVDDSESKAHTVQDVTRKLVMFWGKNFVLTIRRVEQEFFSKIETQIEEMLHASDKHANGGRFICRLVEIVVQGVLKSFEVATENAERLADRGGRDVDQRESRSENLKQMHLNMHRVSLQRRALLRNISVLENSYEQFENFRKEKWVRIIQEGKRNLYLMEEVEQSIANRMNLELSLANLRIAEESQKTGEVMRTLTLFSVIFMPLTLIAGIYGMNFKRLPELNWELGYYYALGLMFSVAMLLMWWFVRKGYLSKKSLRR